MGQSGPIWANLAQIKNEKNLKTKKKEAERRQSSVVTHGTLLECFW
jgi:hypothetical protein